MNDAARYLRTRIGAVVASFRDIARCRARNTAAAAQLKDIVDYSYSYYRLHSLDWAGLFEEHSASLLWADSPYAFARAAALLLGHARDPHISLKVDGETFLSFAPDVVPNYNLETLRRAAAEWSHPSPCVYVGRFGDGIGYVMIGTWSADRVLELEPAFEALNNFSQGGGLVVDVRSNGGGSEDVAKHFAGCFVREPVVYARHKLRDPCASSGFSTPWDRVLAPTRGRPHYGAQTAVLMGQATRSSSEAFLLMMRRVRGWYSWARPHTAVLATRSPTRSVTASPSCCPAGRRCFWTGRASRGAGYSLTCTSPPLLWNCLAKTRSCTGHWPCSRRYCQMLLMEVLAHPSGSPFTRPLAPPHRPRIAHPG